MSSKRDMILLFLNFSFFTSFPKRFLHFCTIKFFNLNCIFLKDVDINFIVEFHFNLLITHPISVTKRRLLIMISPMHQALVMIESTCVVGSLSWKSGMSTITDVWMSYSPTDNSYLNLKQLSVIFVIKIVFLQQILFYIKNMCICVSICLLVLFVTLPILLILVYRCTLLTLMGV